MSVVKPSLFAGSAGPALFGPYRDRPIADYRSEWHRYQRLLYWAPIRWQVTGALAGFVAVSWGLVPAAWYAGCAVLVVLVGIWAGVENRRFNRWPCPRCHRSFAGTSGRRCLAGCVHCGLPKWARHPPAPFSSR